MMVSTDPIADMLTRIRNALAVRQEEVRMPYSKMKHSVADILAKLTNILSGTSVEGEGVDKALVLTILGT
jgi:small subunit ribosomal protein S8